MDNLDCYLQISISFALSGCYRDPKLVQELKKLGIGKATPLILINSNVCRILEPLLKRDGFRVANDGQEVYYPSSGQQGKFRDRFRPILEELNLALPMESVLEARPVSARAKKKSR